MYELRYSPNALKELEKLDKQTIERTITVLERLRIRPESCDIKKLAGRDGYRIRVGEYRIVFDMNKEILTVLVIKIGHRKNSYK